MSIKCKVIGHSWTVEETENLGPLFRICNRCGKYEDAIPGRLYREFHFKKIQPNTINYQTIKLWNTLTSAYADTNI